MENVTFDQRIKDNYHFVHNKAKTNMFIPSQQKKDLS